MAGIGSRGVFGSGGIFGKGLLLGAVVGALWVARRPYSGGIPQLIDWERVRSVALGQVERGDGDEPMLWPMRTALTRSYEEMVRRSEELIRSYVAGPFSLQSSVFVFDRREWVDANLAGFEQLFEPLERVNRDVLGDRTIGSYFLGRANQFLLSSQMGLLIGFLGQRVLGQYDLALLGREPIVGGRLYFVEPNVARLQARLDLDAREFRLWIALHETTHAYEFEVHPWLREYMNGLLEKYFDSLTTDLVSFRRRPGGLADFAQRVGANVLRSSHALELVMSADQRETFQALQALMCLLEGYSNHVMDHVGRSLFSNYPTMKARFDARARQRSPGERLFARLTGLDIKQEQYALGERFVNEVVRERGLALMNRAWETPDHLPTLDEIREPARWMSRAEGW